MLFHPKKINPGEYICAQACVTSGRSRCVFQKVKPCGVYGSWPTFITSFAIKHPILIITLEPRKTCTGERKSVSVIKPVFLMQDEITGYREVHL